MLWEWTAMKLLVVEYRTTFYELWRIKKIIFVDSSLIQIQAIFSSFKSIKIHLKSLNFEAIDELLSNI